jgi:hypothetical protein
MTTYTEYLALLESPVYSPDESRSHLDSTVAGVKRRIQNLHSTAEPLGDDYYHIDAGDNDHYFYKHDGKDVTAFSNIVDGVHYLHFMDAMNAHTPFKDTIYSSNLCQEISIPTSPYQRIKELLVECT